jgi:hypothetical protein
MYNYQYQNSAFLQILKNDNVDESYKSALHSISKLLFDVEKNNPAKLSPEKLKKLSTEINAGLDVIVTELQQQHPEFNVQPIKKIKEHTPEKPNILLHNEQKVDFDKRVAALNERKLNLNKRAELHERMRKEHSKKRDVHTNLSLQNMYENKLKEANLQLPGIAASRDKIINSKSNTQKFLDFAKAIDNDVKEHSF